MMWSNLEVLVTGAGGFIGSHLSEHLVKLGAKVRSFVRYNSSGTLGWLEESCCRGEIEIIRGDIRDRDSILNAVKGCDLVFHLAALVGIPYSYVAPDSYVDTNIKGTLNICQAARESRVKQVIHTSTSEVYGTAKYVPIDEDHPLQPQSPYSATKMAADAIVMSFYNTFDLPVTIARPFNTYGPRQSARAVIPAIIIQIACGNKEIQLGDMTPTRDFNYVEDTCRGLIALAESEKVIGRTANIGSNYEISIGNTFDLIKELMGSDVEFIMDKQRMRPEKSEVFRLWCDNTLIKNLTGFTPQIGIRQGLQRTIDWITQPDLLKTYKTEIYNV